MTDTANDALAGLGIDLGDNGAVTEAVAAEAGAVVEAPTEKAPRAPRKEVEVGEILLGEADELPELVRLGGGGGRTGSKYPFDQLAAPVDNGNGGLKYATFTVNVQAGVDPDALKRSVQSAATAANRDAKASGSGAKFETRSKNVDGVVVGVTVYRTA